VACHCGLVSSAALGRKSVESEPAVSWSELFRHSAARGELAASDCFRHRRARHSSVVMTRELHTLAGGQPEVQTGMRPDDGHAARGLSCAEQSDGLLLGAKPRKADRRAMFRSSGTESAAKAAPLRLGLFFIEPNRDY